MDDLSTNNMDSNELPFGFRPQPGDDRMREENWKNIEAAIHQQEGARLHVLPIENGRRSIAWG